MVIAPPKPRTIGAQARVGPLETAIQALLDAGWDTWKFKGRFYACMGPAGCRLYFDCELVTEYMEFAREYT